MDSSLRVNTLVLKVASRCNLNCTYCYMYNMGDLTYMDQPKFMSYETVDKIIERVRDHCKKHPKMRAFTFVFHGGEPLMLKKEFYYYFVNNAKEILNPIGIECVFQIQTNAVLLDKEWCDVINDLGILIGISLDGRKADNDKYRIDHKGKGSYDSVIKGLKIGQEYLNDRPGLLCVINVDADPLDTYNHFKELGVSGGDFLIPYATHEMPPSRKSSVSYVSEETAYADWLIKIFDQWFYEDNKDRVRIRIFGSLMKMILGRDSSSDNFGNTSNDVLLIETDGGLEPVGALKLCGHGFTKAGANIMTHSFEDALNTKLANLYHLSHKRLCKKCLECPISEVCGGGHIAHRYRKENGFDNPSVYCNDFMKLITHMQNVVVDNFPADKKDEHFTKITYEEVKAYMDSLQFDNLDTPAYEDELKAY